MSLEVFTEPWTRAWADALRQSEAYRRAAERWEGSILIEMEADPRRGIDGERAVFLDLWHGECRGGRVADGEDRDGADYVIRGSAEAWRRILDGELEPIFSLMSGKLKLRRGSLAKLTPYVQASKELVGAAARIGGRFPGAWDETP